MAKAHEVIQAAARSMVDEMSKDMSNHGKWAYFTNDGLFAVCKDPKERPKDLPSPHVCFHLWHPDVPKEHERMSARGAGSVLPEKTRPLD